MRKVKAVTHHHYRFLKETYKMDRFVDLHNTADEIKSGKYIVFENDQFCVYSKSGTPRLVGRFDNLMSAMFRAKD